MSESLTCSEVWGGGAAIDTAFAVPGMDGALYSRPADGRRGGDIYLVSSCNQGLVSKVVLADVAGHGEQIARVGQTLADLLRANVGERDNERFIDQLNRQFEAQDGHGVVFATLACATYFPRNRQFHFAYAGHPLIVFGRSGRFESLAVPPGERSRFSNIPIGITREASFHEGHLLLEPGDWLILFSDGFIEARNENGQEYGLTRMLADLGHLAPTSPVVVKNGLMTRLQDFVLPRRLDQDDVTLIVLRVTELKDQPVSQMSPELEKLLKGRRPPARE